jgi:hypothetical protein
LQIRATSRSPGEVAVGEQFVVAVHDARERVFGPVVDHAVRLAT